ncbi:MAG: phage holin family protein [Myxococcales bacterium]|nr:phage holin family protein [Myxococcales bacterium]
MATAPPPTTLEKTSERTVLGNHHDGSVAALARSSFESLVDLLSAQIKMAKVEMARDARLVLRRALTVSVCLPLIFAGCLALSAAVVALLMRVMPAAAALAVVGGLEVLLGVFGTLVMITRMRRTEALDRTKGEVNRSVEEVGSALSPGSPQKTLRKDS